MWCGSIPYRPGRQRSFEIVQAPRFHDAGEATIEIELAAAPGRKTGTATIAEWRSRPVRGTEGEDP
jgi:hypothetical protein